jgi:hypothetical protein
LTTQGPQNMEDVRSVRVVICAECGGFIEFSTSTAEPGQLHTGRCKSTLGAVDTLIIFIGTNRSVTPYEGACLCLDRLGGVW